MSQRKKLVLFDGHALLHRGYHAIPYLSTKDGTPTNAVYGFVTIMLKALTDLKPDYVAVAWDLPGKTFRHDMYNDYKGTRKKADEDLIAQMPLTREVIEAFNMPLMEREGFEADDVIGTLAHRYSKECEVVIVTGDMDELQLVDDHVKVYTMRRGFSDTVLYDRAAVEEKYGVTPEEFVVYKALKGDTSDNIPGVPGVGDKTATDLVSTYKTLDGIYDHLDELKPAVRKKLEENRELADLSLELSRISREVELDFDLRKAHIHDYDKKHVHDLFHRLEFRSLLTKLPGHNTVNTINEQDSNQGSLFSEEAEAKPAREADRDHLKNAKYTVVNTPEKLKELAENLTRQKVIAFDTETDSVDVINANLVGMSFSWSKAQAYYVPVGHTEGDQLSAEEALAALKPALEDAKIGKVGHNIKFDYQVMKRCGVNLGKVSFDTMVAAFLLNPIGRAQTLSALAFAELGVEMVEITELIGPKGKNQKTFAEVSVSEAVVYASEDADMTWRLYELLAPQLKAYGEVNKVAETMEWPLISVLGDMECAGVELDVDFLHKFAKEINARLTKTEEQIWELAGEKFNIASTQQLKVILFDKLKIESAELKKIKTGVSTAAKELEKLRGAHPIIDLLFDYRESAKLKSTYVDALPLLVNERTGRVHTSYNQTIAQTGRLSSTNPNLQNIPVRTELGREIRKAFVAAKGKTFVSADYSQIELRLAAELAQDKPMIEAFKSGADIHLLTAAEMFGVDPSEVTKQQRSGAKTINFGVLYGMNPHGLSQATGMDYAESRAFIDRYFELRKGVADYIDRIKKEAHQNGYTETIFGRRRPCPDVKSSNYIVRSAAERAAVNMPLQGTAADMMKLAMIKIAQTLPQGAQMILQIHDELIVECGEDQVTEVAEVLRKDMLGVHKFGVPIEVNVSSGRSWGTLEEL